MTVDPRAASGFAYTAGAYERARPSYPADAIAVDPSAPMLAQLREQLPDVDARTGTAEAIPAADGSVDAVFVAQAFHWFRSAEVGAEIARVLVPGGGLAVLWNRARWEEHPWAEEFQALVEPIREAAGSFPAGAWKHGLQESGLFAPLSEVEVDQVHRIGIDEFVDLVASWSWIANLPDEERTAVLGKVRGLVAAQPVLSLRYRTEIHVTHLV